MTTTNAIDVSQNIALQITKLPCVIKLFEKDVMVTKKRRLKSGMVRLYVREQD